MILDEFSKEEVLENLEIKTKPNPGGPHVLLERAIEAHSAEIQSHFHQIARTFREYVHAQAPTWKLVNAVHRRERRYIPCIDNRRYTFARLRGPKYKEMREFNFTELGVQLETGKLITYIPLNPTSFPLRDEVLHKAFHAGCFKPIDLNADDVLRRVKQYFDNTK